MNVIVLYPVTLDGIQEIVMSYNATVYFTAGMCYVVPDSIMRVSMGLTDRRKTAKNLVDSRKN